MKVKMPTSAPLHRHIFALVLLFGVPSILAVPQDIALRLDRDFPDPAIASDGGTYYAYSTSSSGLHYPTATAPSLNGPWTWTGTDAMPDPPGWADYNFWAPDVTAGTNGQWLMYFTAHDRQTGRQCIGVATADRPLGPFRALGDRPLICPADQGGAIDAQGFTDNDGSRWVLWKNDGNAIGVPSVLHIQPVTADGTAIAGAAVELLTNDRPEEGGVVEAPFLVHHGNHYILFYSGGPYVDGRYFQNYAISTSRTGPYNKAQGSWMTTDNLGQRVTGPGGASIFQGQDGDTILFHGWRPEGRTDYRAMYTARLNWNGDDTPQ